MEKLNTIIFGEIIGKIISDFYKQHRSLVFTGFCVSLFSFIFEGVVTPRILANIFTDIKDKEELKNNITKLVSVWLLTQSGFIITEHINSKIEPNLTKHITDVVIKQLFIKYENLHKTLDISTIISRISLITTNIETLIDRIFICLFPKLLNIVVLVINFIVLNKKIGLFILCLLSVQFMLIFRKITDCVKLSYTSVENRDDIFKNIFDKIENIHIISSVSGAINGEIEKCKKDTDDIKNDRINSNKCILNRQVYSYGSNIIIFVCLLGYIYKLYNNNEISGKTITTVLLTIDKLFNQMYEISYYIPDLIKKMGVLDSNKKFMDELFGYEVDTKKDVIFTEPSISINNLNFYYDTKTSIFKDFNMNISPYSKTVIFGKSGCGKSTLIKLIDGILTPISGIIKIGDVNIGDVSKESIKKYITYISQNTSTLFDDTLYNNIIYGYTDSDELKTKIIKIFNDYKLDIIFSNIDKDINKIFLYKVGKHGDNLSGGQKQIIYIIRTFLNDYSKILILDEPTSALDTNTRNIMVDVLIKQNKTILIITHDEYLKNIFPNTIYI